MNKQELEKMIELRSIVGPFIYAVACVGIDYMIGALITPNGGTNPFANLLVLQAIFLSAFLGSWNPARLAKQLSAAKDGAAGDSEMKG